MFFNDQCRLRIKRKEGGGGTVYIVVQFIVWTTVTSIQSDHLNMAVFLLIYLIKVTCSEHATVHRVNWTSHFLQGTRNKCLTGHPVLNYVFKIQSEDVKWPSLERAGDEVSVMI